MKATKEPTKNQDFSILISSNKTPQEVYEAINDVKAWWIGDIEGGADTVGSKFTYRYKDFHESTQKVRALAPGKKVVWHVEHANLSFVKSRHEWEGTDIVFEISQKGDQTEVKFTHHGLTPEVECYEACSSGWEFYIIKSLNN